MKFAEPQMGIIAVSAAAGLAVFYAHAFRARRRALARFADEGLWKDVLASVDERGKRVKAALLAGAVVACCLALMRPLWGFHWQDVRRTGLDVVIAIDTSKSMLAQDMKPSRLGRAKLAVREFAGYASGDRLGLIAFAGTAFTECPLTLDYGGFLLSLDALDVETIPRGGTNIGGAIREAVRSFEGAEKKYKALVIISDGEELEGDALKAAGEAKEKGIVVYAIGVGTPDGELIPAPGSAAEGMGAYLKDAEGNVVKSRLKEELLQRVAVATGGSYIRATNTGFGLDVLYREKISRMEKRGYQSALAKRYEERFQYALALALVMLVLEAFISDRRRGGGCAG